MSQYGRLFSCMYGLERAAAALEATLTAMKGATFNGTTDSLEALRAIAVFRLVLPRTILRFAGGREITLGDLDRFLGRLADGTLLGPLTDTVLEPRQSLGDGRPQCSA